MDDVTKVQIHEAVRTRVSKGLNYQQIESEFINAGYTKEQIQTFYNEVTNSPVQSISELNSNHLHDRSSYLTTIFVTSFFLVCVLVVIFAAWLFKDNLVVFVDGLAQKSELTLTVFDSWIDASGDLISLGKVTEKQAKRLCGIGSHDTSCRWGEVDLPPNEDNEGDFTVILLTEDDYLKEGERYEIGIENTSRNRTYRVFVLHEDLLGRLNGINEVILTEAQPRDNMRVYSWNLSQVSGFVEQSATLSEGTYSIVAVEVETGLTSEKSSWFRVKSEDKSNSEDNIAYAANTPLVNSFWDGRGVFFSGGESQEDTLTLVGDMEMYDIFRGVDFSEKNELDTIVFVQAGSVVIVAFNVEFVNFDNRKFTIEDLIEELEDNGNSIYRTKPFDVEQEDKGNDSTSPDDDVIVVTPENINEIISNQQSNETDIDWSVLSPGSAKVAPTTESDSNPSVEIVDVKLPTIFVRYNNLPPVFWDISSTDYIIPITPLESGGSGVLELTLPAAAFPGSGDYVVKARARDDSNLTVESAPYYIALPERPEILNATAKPKAGASSDEVTLTWKTKNAEYCRIRDAYGKVFASKADSNGSMTVQSEDSKIFDFYCFGYDMSEYGFSTPNNRQWDIAVIGISAE